MDLQKKRLGPPGAMDKYVTFHNLPGRVETIDARETAPMSASNNMIENESKPGLLIAVPGELRGYELAHKRHGRLKWKELFEPSIKLAFDGFKIDSALAKAIQKNKNTILGKKSLCDVFCHPNNTTLRENDTIRFPKLAATYCRIAEEGANIFYSGSLTQTIVDDIKAEGGNITHQDLKDYEPALNESALNFTVGKYMYFVPGAPFGGPLLALMLKILNGYGMSSSNMSTDGNKILTYHRIIETFRFASQVEGELIEQHPDHVNAFVQNIISDDYAAAFIRNPMKDDTNKQLSNKEEHILCKDAGTSHLSVIADDGSAVAVTSSINRHFGSKVISQSTGIIFNDQLCDFRYAHLIKPGRKPPSSMSPTIILDKGKPKNEQVKMVVGASGGRIITSATVQVILNYLFFGYNLQKAIKEPRVHSQLNPDKTFVEDHFEEDIKKHLKKYYNIVDMDSTGNPNVNERPPVFLGKVQAVVRQGEKICAESDPRKGGHIPLDTDDYCRDCSE
ncbi:glutathione hydrolase 1 proenzyme-like [Carassius gibelio]|uniref:glutathione hydrolase 1 proenzyme-like n=1 Tax=Carassius gibelio TaxID=101364 RepID=UPI0022791347|nr:glutathione hydrolase 1 proenzyme-like [Carassius gibelio]